uniref:Gustatory receptor n=2 Tax=Graphocephala atropunctata TaxID=36148 RepID=A0A1B6L7Y2_9HEMI
MKVQSDQRCQTQAFPTEILWFCQLFGGFPLKYSSDTNGTKRLRFSPAVFLWGLVVVIVQTVVLMTWLGMIYKHALLSQNVALVSNTTLMAVTMDVFSLTLMIVVVFTSYVRKYPNIINCAELLEKVDRNLSHKMHGLKTRLWILLISLFTVTMLAYSAITEYKRPLFAEIKVLQLFKSIICHFPILNVYCTQAALFFHFTYITDSIAKTFQINNARIKQEVTRRSLVYQSLSSEGKKQEPSTTQLKVLIDNYWLLCDAVCQANSFYCDQMLVTIFSSFFHITVALYYLIVHINLGDIKFIANDGAWGVVYICHLILLIRPSSEVTASADETAPMICQLINMTPDPAIKRQVKSFLLQVPNHNARFSALGFFDLRNDILTSMAGAVTTYVVIMFQFQSQNHT